VGRPGRLWRVVAAAGAVAVLGACAPAAADRNTDPEPTTPATPGLVSGPTPDIATQAGPEPGPGRVRANVAGIHPERPHTATTFTLALADLSRPTRSRVTGEELPVRMLPTVVRLPHGDSPSPLVVFSHGLGSSPGRFTRLLDHWAAAGFVVVAPQFPLTSDANPNHNLEVDDQENLPADISAVLDGVLDATSRRGNPREGRIDPTRIAAAGFSLGGGATYALAFNDCCIDERIGAAAIFGSAVLIHGGNTDLARPLPLLVVHSTGDEALSYGYARYSFEKAGGPAWLVTLAGPPHHDPFDDTPTDFDAAVMGTTTAFWDLTLLERGDDARAELVLGALAGGDLVDVEYSPRR